MKEPLDPMAQIKNRAGTHRGRNLQKNKAGTGIDVGLSRPLKGDHHGCNLQSGQQQ
jgi:hypothetical protein